MVVNPLADASTWERVVILAPALVIGAGLVLGVMVLLTWLGVELPRE